MSKSYQNFRSVLGSVAAAEFLSVDWTRFPNVFQSPQTSRRIYLLNFPTSPEVPYLSLKLEFTQSQILEVMNDSKLQIKSNENAKRALFVGQMESSLMDAILRLTRLLDKPEDIPFLSPLFTKEILYKLLHRPVWCNAGSNRFGRKQHLSNQRCH